MASNKNADKKTEQDETGRTFHTLGPWDIVCGRGRAATDHVGNKRLRVLVCNYVDLYYSQSTNVEKTKIVTSIVQMIRDAGGHFLNRATSSTDDNEKAVWYDIGDKKAKDKVRHSLRDVFAELKEVASANATLNPIRRFPRQRSSSFSSSPGSSFIKYATRFSPEPSSDEIRIPLSSTSSDVSASGEQQRYQQCAIDIPSHGQLVDIDGKSPQRAYEDLSRNERIPTDATSFIEERAAKDPLEQEVLHPPDNNHSITIRQETGMNDSTGNMTGFDTLLSATLEQHQINVASSTCLRDQDYATKMVMDHNGDKDTNVGYTGRNQPHQTSFPTDYDKNSIDSAEGSKQSITMNPLKEVVSSEHAAGDDNVSNTQTATNSHCFTHDRSSLANFASYPRQEEQEVQNPFVSVTTNDLIPHNLATSIDGDSRRGVAVASTTTAGGERTLLDVDWPSLSSSILPSDHSSEETYGVMDDDFFKGFGM